MALMHLVKVLENLGLNEKEAAVYLANLEIGPSTVQRLAAKSRIKRTTVYLIAELLKEKGLLSEYKNRRGIQYVSIQPDRLLSILDKQKAAIQEVIPELLALTNNQETNPSVRFNEGKEGVLAIINDTLGGEGGEVLFFGSYSDIYLYASSVFLEQVYRPTRIRKKIYMRGLVTKEPRALALHSRDKESFRELRFLPSGTDFVTAQYIYQNKIAYISPRQEAMGLIIESKDLAAMERYKFELNWNACKSS
ncbi:MAG: helix-turn-helix domain-containing protein [Patescibacteria group bacterium]